MLSAIKLVISENGKMLETITKDTGTQPKQLINSLEDFQQSANAMLTKLIETHGESVNLTDDMDEDDDEEDADEQVSPRKKKK